MLSLKDMFEFSSSFCVCATFSAAATMLVFNCAGKKKQTKPAYSDDYTWIYIGNPNVLEQMDSAAKTSKGTDTPNSNSPLAPSQTGSKVSKVSRVSNRSNLHDFKNFVSKNPTVKPTIKTDRDFKSVKLAKTTEKSVKPGKLLKPEKSVKPELPIKPEKSAKPDQPIKPEKSAKPELSIKPEKSIGNHSEKREKSFGNDHTYCTVKPGNEDDLDKPEEVQEKTTTNVQKQQNAGRKKKRKSE